MNQCSYWKIENETLFYKHILDDRWNTWRSAEYEMGIRLEQALMRKIAEVEFEKEILKS